MSLLKNLIGMSRERLTHFLLEFDDKPFRAEQVMKWLYHQGITDVTKMSNLSKDLRSRLAEVTCYRLPRVLHQKTSKDGTTKWVMESFDGGAVECVLIPDGRRNTLCISSQRGCSLDCAFCATGKQGFGGNLNVEDIVGQVLRARDWLSQDDDRGTLTNIVFMGMGEPLLNFEPVMAASEIFVDDCAFGISKRRVTVSTAGVVPRILDMCGRTEVSLAISLHAPNDDLRSYLVPLNKKYPITTLLDACKSYLASLSDRRIITIEYTLIDDVNDSVAIARQLADLVKNIRCKVNLIPFNPIPNSSFRRPNQDKVLRFYHQLMDRGVMATNRTTRGDDIEAACGQLVGDFVDKTRRRKRYATDNTAFTM